MERYWAARQHLVIVVCLLVATRAGHAQQVAVSNPATPLDATTAILEAFQSHSVVTLSEGTHGNEQGLAFRLSLIRDPRFFALVNDIVIEGPNARFQDVVDRYVLGEDVPITTVWRAWDESTQVQASSGSIHEEVVAVRQLNASLPANRKLRVLLADPPIDWDQVRTKEDHAKWIAQRDTFPAQLIEREVLAKHRRALVVFGNMHFQRKQLLANYESAGDGPLATVVSALEQAGTKTKVFSIWTATDAELSDVQPDVAGWRVPTLTIVQGTVLGAADFTRYYPFSVSRFAVRDGQLTPVPRDQWRMLRMDEQFDAILYLGPRSSITMARQRIVVDGCADPGFVERHVMRASLVGLPSPEIDRLKQLCTPGR